jgi:hypothetical protein
MAFDLDIGILSPRPLSTKEEGRAFLELLCNSMPELAPQRYGNYEPLKALFDCVRLEEALEAWKWPFLWKRRQPLAEGNVWMRDPKVHAAIYVSTQAKSVDEARLIMFFQEAVNLVRADFSYLNIMTKEEVDAAEKNEIAHQMIAPFTQGVTTHDLRKYLPNICWATVFGPPYVQLFGRERLLSAPAAVVQELADETIYIQLSESLLDPKWKYDDFNAVRREVKEYLDRDAFFDPDLGIAKQYRIPEFEWRD